MQKFKTLISTVAPFFGDNVDTDQIIPARFLTVTDKHGLAENLFVDLRYNEDKTPKTDFILNKREYKNARVLLAHNNFGCGSSREHAPWALLGYGFKVIVAISFADIFENNALKNSLLPITLSATIVDAMHADVERNSSEKAIINLEAQTITWIDVVYHFEINPFAKKCLLEGLDDIGYTLSFAKDITIFEERNYSTIFVK
ncbi:MAG: 3-isopropylmalate dehydratase small subunit [Patescibacteria group bacterium]